MLTSFYFGPVTPQGEDFENSHDAFAEGFQQPFAAHAKRCFREGSVPGWLISADNALAKHVREARTLKTSGSQPVGDDDEATVKMLSSGAGDPPVTDAPASVGYHSTAMPSVDEVDYVDEIDANFNGDIGGSRKSGTFRSISKMIYL